MPKFVLVASKADSASSNVASALIREQGFREAGSFAGDSAYARYEDVLVFSDRPLLYSDHLDRYFAPECFIFLSKHSSKEAVPALTAHFPGNLTDEAKMGGRPTEVAKTRPALLRAYLRSLWARRDRISRFEITLEATHHGPTSLAYPALFVELGSSEGDWRDEQAASTMAQAIVEAMQSPRSSGPIGIALGGTHYSDKFTKLLVEEGNALAAIVPKYALSRFDEAMLRQVMEKSPEPITHAFLDWKGLGGEKQRLMALLKDAGLEIVRV